ncbi:MAG TPA: PD-(D/E)XK nuclease family protein [Verrucomicrobiae bacterium]|nr:PD-(D/E)XK nuclease family protein [Verrucomicrobiae bacterium]
MRATFLLGPAGSGKTHRCRAEIRAELLKAPQGPPLILLAPKQATFQLERQLLADDSLPGYTRLHILSFDRLARFVFDRLDRPFPELLSEEGRVMVLRALLGRRKEDLRLFRASARLPGFARQLSELLRELQRHHLTCAKLEALSQKVGPTNRLDAKLNDLALLLRGYQEWLKEHRLLDADSLLDLATDELRSAARAPAVRFALAGLWLDGFAQMTPQERALLGALAPFCQRATLAFCVDGEPAANLSWHSPGSVASETYRKCRDELAGLAGVEIEVELLERKATVGRFARQPALQHLEREWAQPKPFQNGATDGSAPPPGVRVVACANPEAEAVFAAREILRYVRDDGVRFRDVAVLVRKLDGYHDALRRVFTRYQIPFFLDRREPVAHHPLAELTRCALRTVAFGWRSADWFGALKSGLVNAAETEIDWLENEALARGWEGKAWQSELKFDGDSAVGGKLERLRQQLVQPFKRLRDALGAAQGQGPTGRELAAAIQSFWEQLKVGRRLREWSAPAPADGSAADPRAQIHDTVLDQMQHWIGNVALAFAGDSLLLTEWLPILESGLAGLTVGVIPPALDQVLIGAIDRSRNPDLRRAFVLGVNETIFPAVPAVSSLLSEWDRNRLDQHDSSLGTDTRSQLGLERFYGYVACTRSSEQIAITCASRDSDGRTLNPSTFIAHLKRLFPSLEIEKFGDVRAEVDVQHSSEMIASILRDEAAGPGGRAPGLSAIAALPVFAPILDRLRLPAAGHKESLSPELAVRLFGPVLETSVSRLEQFAMCPFRFLVNSGLQAEERKLFELDARQQGSFQHEVLARFHQELSRENKRWRDITPAEASERIGRIADQLIPHFAGGMLVATGQNRFVALSYKESLQRFIAAMVEWMKQYEFDPTAVEIGFGGKDGLLARWELDLGDGHRIALRGRIDRVDLWRDPDRNEALCVVIDYKSSQRKLDPLLMAHGIQQQLPAYLNVLRRVPAPPSVFGVSRLIPAGVFYVNLRGRYESGANRTEVLEGKSDARRHAYVHEGLFDFDVLRKLDNRRGARFGDQFNYRLTKDNKPYKNSQDALNAEEFMALLDHEEELLRDIGRRIYAGDVRVDPYKKGQETACDTCEYQSICRIDRWMHEFRPLRNSSGVEEAAE